MKLLLSIFYPLIMVVVLFGCKNDNEIPNESNPPMGEETVEPNGIRVLNDCDPCTLDLYTGFLLDGEGIDGSNFTVYKQGVFAYWWDSRFGISAEIQAFANVIDGIAADLADFGVGNPLAFGAGQYTNIYIHRGDDDVFPNYFGNGTGFEGEDVNNGIAYAYLAYPYSEDLSENRVNIFHEVFHVYQGPYTYKGEILQDAELVPNAVWAVEGYAEWYQMSRLANSEVRAFENTYSIYAAPDIPLWDFRPRAEINESEFTEDQLGAMDWVFGIRQYAHGTFLHFLSNIKGVSDQIILDAWFDSSQTAPQETLYQLIGAETFRSYFVEWAARNAGNFDYLSTDQVNFSRNNYQSFAIDLPAGKERPFAIQLQDSNANGNFSPQALYRPRAWAYNTIKINNTAAANYSFSLSGNATGSAGSAAHFEAYIAVRNANGSYTYQPVSMTNTTSGSGNIQVQATDTKVLFIVASVPEVFDGEETFNYSLNILRN